VKLLVKEFTKTKNGSNMMSERVPYTQ